MYDINIISVATVAYILKWMEPPIFNSINLNPSLSIVMRVCFALFLTVTLLRSNLRPNYNI